jgi:uncharacterized protein GlcG (DUF336 family)
MASAAFTHSPATITAVGAQRVMVAAAEKAAELQAPSTVAVVDAQGILKALLRMDGSPLIGVDLARQKAYTVVAMGGVSTGRLAAGISGNPSVLAALTSLPDVAVLAGGLPLVLDGVVVGAVGVSAPTGGMDVAVAEAAVDAFSGDAVS